MIAPGSRYHPDKGVTHWHTRWRAFEDQYALEMRRLGKSAGYIAKALPRSPDAVAARLRLLGEAAR